MPARDAHTNYQRSMTGNVDSARLLMEFSMVPSVKAGGSKLHKAAAAGDVEEVERLVDVTQGTALVDPTKGDGTTPLITAAMMGHADVVRILLEQEADPEKVGLNGASALMIASSMGR
jgi:ankyrin repeat protein